MPRVIVIGASRGIGEALARSFAADGWSVLATVRDAAGEAALAGVANLELARADVTDEGSLEALAGGTVDLIVVNAGVGSQAGLKDLDPAEWTRVMTVNALGPLLAARALGGRLAAGGSFVALSSLMGSIADNSGGGAYSYRMSKAALNMGLQNLAIEWRDRAVAALHPGWVQTAMGGPQAPVSIADSVAGLRRVVTTLKPGPRAVFLDYRGNRLDW